MYIFVDMVFKIMYSMYTFRQMRSKPWTRKTLSHSVCKYSLWRFCSSSWRTKRQQKWNRLHYLVSRHRLLLLSSIPIRPSTLRTVKGWRETVFRIKEELLWVVVKSFLLSSHTSYRAGPFGPALVFTIIRAMPRPIPLSLSSARVYVNSYLDVETNFSWFAHFLPSFPVSSL